MSTAPTLNLDAPGVTAAGASPRGGVTAWAALIALCLIVLMTTVDRQIWMLQSEAIRKHMQLSDLQLGLLQGTAVSLCSALFGYPAGWLADRFDRRWVLIGLISMWCLACVGSGVARSYPELLVASGMVGVAEAGISPIILAMIPMLFAAHRWQIANSVYAIVSTAGAAVTTALCGLLIANVESLRPLLPLSLQTLDGWRLTFIAAALPAPLLMLMAYSVGAHAGKPRPAAPERGEADAEHGTSGIVLLMPYLRRHARSLLPFYVGLGLTILGLGAAGWTGNALMRQFGETPEHLAAMLGMLGISALALAFVLSTLVLPRLAKSWQEVLPLRMMAISCVIAAAMQFSMPWASSASQIYAASGVFAVATSMITMMFPTALQGLAPSTLRARVFAVAVVICSIGSASALPLSGWISDQLKHLPNGVLIAAACIGVPALCTAALLIYRCEDAYLRTVAEAAREDAEAAEVAARAA